MAATIKQLKDKIKHLEEENDQLRRANQAHLDAMKSVASSEEREMDCLLDLSAKATVILASAFGNKSSESLLELAKRASDEIVRLRAAAKEPRTVLRDELIVLAQRVAMSWDAGDAGEDGILEWAEGIAAPMIAEKLQIAIHGDRPYTKERD